MLLGFSFIGLQLAFALLVGGWVMMLVFLRQHPAPADWPRDPFTRWQLFLKGEGFPPESQATRKLIKWMFYIGIGAMALALVCFFAGGGPDALEAPAQAPR